MVFEECRFRCGFHRPVVPLAMQIIKIHNRTRAEFHPRDFIGWRARTRMVPRADDEKMFRPRLRRGVRHVIAVKCKRTQFVTVVLARDCQYRLCDLLKLFMRREHRIIVRIDHGMFEDTLEIFRRVTDKRVEVFESDVLFITVEKFRAPEFLITEKIVLCCPATGEREPLHVISQPNIIVGWVIEARMCSCRGNDCRQMWRKFLCRGPLIESRVRPAPHRDLAIAKRVFRKPLDYVVSVARFICKWLELTTGISATAYIDKRECITM